ncbi:MAG: DUF3782 domain-containing protein [Bacteroidota bacterium]
MQYTRQQILDVVNNQLLLWIKKDEAVKNAVFKLVQTKHPTKKETDDKFEKMLLGMSEERIRQDKKWEAQEKKWENYLKELADYKEAQEKKWENYLKELADHKEVQEKKWEAQEKKWEIYLKELADYKETQEKKWENYLKELADYKEAQEKKWETQEKKWEENQKTINTILEEIKASNRKHDQSIGAIGSRWGLHSEASFRNALKGILREMNPQYEVIRYDEFDNEGIVFDKPGPIEIDVIIKNGKIYLIEIKSSISKADIVIFLRKVKYYEKRHKQKVFQSIIISPMIDEKAKEFAGGSKIILYSYADNVIL